MNAVQMATTDELIDELFSRSDAAVIGLKLKVPDSASGTDMRTNIAFGSGQGLLAIGLASLMLHKANETCLASVTMEDSDDD